MVKIEMAVQISQEYPAGKSDEFIWMSGQPWPVPAEEDIKIIRLEVFGTELEELTRRFAGGQSQREAGQTGRETCRTWYMQDARYVSEQMRIFYPPSQS